MLLSDLKELALLETSTPNYSFSVKHSSMIYSKNMPDRNLTEYEIAVNSASFELAKANPGLLAKRDELFLTSKRKSS